MADSSFLTHVVEPYVVKWVSRQIGMKLQPKRVAVGQDQKGKGVRFAFDGVSEDGRVGLLVSTSHTGKPGVIHKLHADAATLLNAPFQRRVMAFISNAVCQHFGNKCDGLLPLGKIEMLVCTNLPAKMRKEIAKFQAAAKSEVGDRGKVWKPGGKRR